MYLRSWRLFIVIDTLFVGIFLFGLDVNIIGVAIPKITTEFGSLDEVAWYGSAYLLTVTAFQPGFGNLYRFFNTKRVYLVSLFIFEVGSAVCGSAPKSEVLILGRALLGVGAAGLLQGALAIISQIVPLDKVPMYQGIVIGAIGISVCTGPIIGGALTEYTSWRWCFWINVPAGAVVILVVILFVPISQKSKDEDGKLSLPEKFRRMDPIGTILFLGFVCCLLLVLVWGGQTYSWSDSRVIGVLVGSATLLACFCYWMWRQGEMALIPLRILRKRSIAMGAVTLFAISMPLNIYGYYLPLFFQTAQGTSVTTSGIRQIALMVPDIVGIALTGFVVSKWGYYIPYMVAGSVIASVGAGLLTTIDAAIPTAKWAAYLVITGIGVGMSFQLPYTAVQVVLEPVDVPTGNAIAVFSSQLSGAIGLAIGQNLLVHGLEEAIPEYTNAVTPAAVIGVGAAGLSELSSSPAVLDALRHAYADAIRWTMYLAVAAMCIAFPSSCSMEWLNIKHVAEQRKARDEMEPQNHRNNFAAPIDVNEEKKRVISKAQSAPARGCKTEISESSEA
ncbi:Putative HC-toxin efflux carrier TOXA [Cytospora mali]|uniref:HC-toxin efflux carrier TOXA n=1 Tax=Cytospora mali TaxID=578113 RepID=A0A194V6C2_CYTMA|nr:Putative HC-toxin efflux carrier TOXA [Valsa mali var. pyri (nom. inval.)]